MRYTGTIVDSEHVGPWYEHIGKFIINFGSIEQITIEWLRIFGLADDLSEASCFERIVELRRQIRSVTAAPKGLKRIVTNTLTDAERMLKFRNRIAHGPVVLIYMNGDETKPPLWIGHYNHRHVQGASTRVASLQELKKNNDEAVAIARRLDERLEQMRQHYPHEVPATPSRKGKPPWWRWWVR